MPVGNKIRQDNITATEMSITGNASCDPEMLAGLTQEGCLASGALPAMEVASEKGAKKLVELMGSEAVKSKKNPKDKNKGKGESEEVVPKTPIESSPQFLCVNNFKIASCV